MSKPEVSIGNMKTEVTSIDDSGFSFTVGDMIGQYEVLSQLGRGGMGEVYKVLHTTLELEYALKLLPVDFSARSGALTRFKDEAKVMARLNHPNIVKVDEFGETNDRYWLRMELMDGISDDCVSLEDLVRENDGYLDQGLVAKLMIQVLDGLEYAHKHGAIHRDLKPANILLNKSGSEINVKISDFGLVKLAGDEWVRDQAELSMNMSISESIGDMKTVEATINGTSTNALLGTYAYMSPEQKRGDELDSRSDLYSIGLILFKILTGEADPSFELPSDINSDLVKDWDEIVKKSMANKAERRYATAAKMQDKIKTTLISIYKKEEQQKERIEKEHQEDKERKHLEDWATQKTEEKTKQAETENFHREEEKRWLEAEAKRERISEEQQKVKAATKKEKKQKSGSKKKKIIILAIILFALIAGIISINAYRASIRSKQVNAKKFNPDKWIMENSQSKNKTLPTWENTTPIESKHVTTQNKRIVEAKRIAEEKKRQADAKKTAEAKRQAEEKSLANLRTYSDGKTLCKTCDGKGKFKDIMDDSGNPAICPVCEGRGGK